MAYNSDKTLHMFDHLRELMNSIVSSIIVTFILSGLVFVFYNLTKNTCDFSHGTGRSVATARSMQPG